MLYEVIMAAILQPVLYRNCVGRFAFQAKGRDGAKYELMFFAVKVPGAQSVTDLIETSVIEHKTAEDRLLGFDRLRWDP